MCYWYYSPYELVPHQIFAKSELFRSMWSGILVQSVTRRFGPYFPHRSELIRSIFSFQFRKNPGKNLRPDQNLVTKYRLRTKWALKNNRPRNGPLHFGPRTGPNNFGSRFRTLGQEVRTGTNKIGPNLLTTDRTKTVGPIIQGSIECSGWKFDVW